MTSIRLTFATEIRRLLVAASVIVTLGVAGTVVGRVASKDEAKPASAAKLEAVDETAVQLTAATIAPEVAEQIVNPQMLVPVVVPAAAAAAAPAIAAPKLTTIEMEVTAYCPCTKCCGPKAQGITASGKRVDYNLGRFVAADRKFAFGTKLIVPGYAGGSVVEVTDRGGAIKGNKLDVYFASHIEALKWGRQKLTVTVVE